MDTYLQTAITAAKASGKLFKQYFGHPAQITKKGGNYRNLVTEVDLKIEHDIKILIKKKFPSHNFLGEETGWDSKNTQGYNWIIDPIDGTTNFIQGIPFCCTSVALWKGDEPLVGVVYNPILDQLYSAQLGKGAFLNNKPIHVSFTRPLSHALGGVGWSKSIKLGEKLFNSLLPLTRKARALGSTTIQLCLTAQGSYDYYIVGDMNIWDIAAGVLLVQEAGGKVTDWKGGGLKNDAKQVISSNGKVHDKLLKLVKKISA